MVVAATAVLRVLVRLVNQCDVVRLKICNVSNSGLRRLSRKAATLGVIWRRQRM